MKTIETERLTLTPMTVADYPHVCAMNGDPEFMRHISGKTLGPELVWMRLLRDIGHWQVFGHGNYAVRVRDSGDWIGVVGVFDYKREIVPALEAPELGWGIMPAFHGKGYAAEAVAAVLNFADTVMQAPRTVCIIDYSNEASMKLALRSGFKPLNEAVFHDQPVAVLQRVRNP